MMTETIQNEYSMMSYSVALRSQILYGRCKGLYPRASNTVNDSFSEGSTATAAQPIINVDSRSALQAR